jgi:ABC-2 type transport system ATP-binding protein
MSHDIELHDLAVHFAATRAVDGVTATLAGGSIVGLLGRNGAGKTTLLGTIAALRRPTSGTVRVDGEDPYEHRRLMSEICFVRTDPDVDHGFSVPAAIGLVRRMRPSWDQATMDRLLDRFGIDPGKKVRELSRGQRSALYVSIGLAVRAPVTLFDEPHLGMDAPARYAFYDELLASYMETPRTIVVSTHLIDEMARLFEDVVILDQGRVLAHQKADELAERGVQITGPAAAVDEITRDMAVLSSRSLGPTKSAVVFGQFNGCLRDHAAAVGVELGPIPLQDLFVSLTTAPTKENDR